MADALASIDAASAKFLRDTKAAMARAVDQAADLLLAQIKQNISRIDHSLRDLELLGHPYRQGSPAGNPHPDWIVHIQSGKLIAGTAKLPVSLQGNRIRAGITSSSPYTWYLLLGTRLMRPRDYVSAAIILIEREIQQIFENAFASVQDKVAGNVQPLNVTLISHDLYSAQLPNR